MPLILSGTFLLVMVFSEFGLLGMLPFWDPWSFCHRAHPYLGPQLVTIWFLFLFLAILLVGFLERKSMLDILKDLIFSFLMVFVLSQSDIY